MISGVQVLGIIFGLVMIFVTHIHFKKKELKWGEFLMWISAWSLLIVFSIIPGIFSPLAETFNLVRLMDIFVALGFVFVIVVSYYNYIKMKRLHKKIVSVVRNMAMEKKK